MGRNVRYCFHCFLEKSNKLYRLTNKIRRPKLMKLNLKNKTIDAEEIQRISLKILYTVNLENL